MQREATAFRTLIDKVATIEKIVEKKTITSRQVANKLKLILTLRSALIELNDRVDELSIQYELEPPESLQKQIDSGTSSDFFEIISYLSKEDLTAANEKLDFLANKLENTRLELLRYLFYGLLDKGKIFFDSWAAKLVDDSDLRIDYASFQEKLKTAKAFNELDSLWKPLFNWSNRVGGKRKDANVRLVGSVISLLALLIAIFKLFF